MDHSPATVLHCTQCGGELHPDAGQLFVTCPFCGSTVYIDKSRVVFHWWVAPTLDPTKAQAALRAWMAGNATVKDLDQKARVVGQTFQYFPMWYFKHKANKQEQVFLEPAAAISVSELRSLRLPAGDLRKYDTTLDSQAIAPSVPLPTALEWLAQRRVPANEIAESSLVHIPLYTFKYDYQGRVFTALVEAATGRTLANIFPAKAEAPYLIAGCLVAVVYLGLALLPLITPLIMQDEAGIAAGFLACGGLGLCVMPFLFALAAWVAAKV